MLPWDTPLAINAHASYLIYPPHRNGHHNKSQWRLNEDDELACFRKAYENECCVGHVGWGLHMVSGVAETLGVSIHKEELKIAKFVDSNKNSLWHGYPADYRRKRQDVPSDSVLQKWIQLNLIDRRQAVKLKGGRPCGL